MKKNILKVIIASLVVFQLMFFNLSVNASSNTNPLKISLFSFFKLGILLYKP
jgi:hypothetical protein